MIKGSWRAWSALLTECLLHQTSKIWTRPLNWWRSLTSQNEKAIRFFYQNVTSKTIVPFHPPPDRQKPPKKPLYTKVCVNFMYDRFWYCPKNCPSKDHDHEALFDSEDNHPSLTTPLPTTAQATSTSNNTTSATNTDDEGEEENELDIKIIAALGKDASQAVGIKGNSKTIRIDGNVVLVASLCHPGKVLYEMGTFSRWCERHGQQGALQDLSPEYRDANLDSDTVFNFLQRTSSWRYLLGQLFSGGCVVVVCFEDGKMYYIPDVEELTQLIPPKSAENLFGKLARDSKDDVEKAKRIGGDWTKSRTFKNLRICIGSIYNGGHLSAPFVEHVFTQKFGLPANVSKLLYETFVSGDLMSGAQAATCCSIIATSASQKASHCIATFNYEFQNSRLLSFFGLVQKLHPRGLAVDRNGSFWNYHTGEFSISYTASAFLKACSVAVVPLFVKQPVVYVRVKKSGHVDDKWYELAFTKFSELAEVSPAAAESDGTGQHVATIVEVKVCLKSIDVSREWVFSMERPLVIAVSDNLIRHFKLSFAQMVNIQCLDANFSELNVHLPNTVGTKEEVKKRGKPHDIYRYVSNPVVFHGAVSDDRSAAPQPETEDLGEGVAALKRLPQADIVVKKLLLMMARLASIPLPQNEPHVAMATQKAKCYIFWLEENPPYPPSRL
ncbi:hypothetical protein HDV05_001207 [Chytridiales sp. JEL 0842]|nr:hypothetical protein HDV05_001207 [Chytridiales sp. JEL 0842]